MHPHQFWKYAQEARRARHCGEAAHAGEGGNPFGGPFEGWRAGGHGHGDWGHGGGGLGVRRPLRFLAHKLDLRDDQVAELARILGELKTERAQAEVDDRRTVAAFADAVAPETFDEARAKEAGDLRVKSAENLRGAVTRSLQKIHALLDEEQRKQLAYLIRTGVLTL
ncbi:MAG: Spy/CpxP family protein refolding chaperone [Polyangiaceae bacterium]